MERRRLQRVKLLQPLAGKIDGQRVFVLDVSRHGLLAAHQENFGAEGSRHRVEFEWDARHVAMDVTLRHTRVHRLGRASHARNVYHSGFTIVSITSSCEQTLREMIAWHIER